MGHYINPPNMTKEEWLQKHGQVTETAAWPAPEGTIPVCLVKNPTFTAAGIAYCEREFLEFLIPDATPEEIAAVKQQVEAAGAAFYSLDTGGQRPRIWYYVPIEKIIEVAPEMAELISN